MIDPSKLKIALIMNALVCPGAGHVVMGRKKKGYLMILACISLALAPAFRFAISLAKAMGAIGNGASAWEKFSIAAPAAWKAEKQFILICLIILILTWAYSLFDAFRMAKTANSSIY